MSRAPAKRRGWIQAAPGYWARGAFRIQRLTRGWRWWHVVRLRPDSPEGVARTLNGQPMDAVDGIVPGAWMATTPPDTTGREDT